MVRTITLRETRDGLILRLMVFKDGDEFRDRQKILDAFRRIEEFERSSLSGDRRIALDHATQAGAVHIRDAGQVEHQLAGARLKVLLDRFPQLNVPFAQQDLSLKIEN